MMTPDERAFIAWVFEHYGADTSPDWIRNNSQLLREQHANGVKPEVSHVRARVRSDRYAEIERN